MNRFNFSQRGSLKKWDSFETKVQSVCDGTVDAIFMWWDLEMDSEGEIILSCAPSWAHPDGKALPVCATVFCHYSILDLFCFFNF